MSEVVEDAKRFLRWNRISHTEEDAQSIQAFIDALDRMGYRVVVEAKPRGAYYSWVESLSSWMQHRLKELTIDELYSFRMCDFMRLHRIGESRANKIVVKRTAFIRSHPELFKDGKPIKNELS